MGCRSLWKFFANKKHQPSIRYHRHLAKGLQECRVRHASTNTNNKVRVDVMGSIFSTIQYAYTHCSREAAHALVHKRLKKLANPLISVLYFDGDPTTEKESTHDERAKVRRKAEVLADEKINEFEVRINNGQRIRKQHFVGIQKQLSRTFQWNSEDRLSLIDYLRDHQWIVQLSPYEADVHIADDCAPGDIVISGDSDLIIHPTVTTVWRPISGSRFQEYIVDEVLAVLGIGRPQLVTLGVVSHNDYNKNIYGLGCATNYKIIKDLPKAGM
ncbi:hypothetical protein BKA57DRAFT_292657 [Linnemannia elongata]|nr:hypothetical protein BKA57DRAFT_292657 [Linnemannia elongata]